MSFRFLPVNSPITAGRTGPKNLRREPNMNPN